MSEESTKEARLAAERLERATAEAREVLREVHGVEKDMQRSMKAARRLTQDLVRKELRTTLEDLVLEYLHQMIGNYRLVMERAIDENEKRVGKRFDEIVKMLELHTDDEKIRTASLDEMIRVQRTLKAWEREREAEEQRRDQAMDGSALAAANEAMGETGIPTPEDVL